MICTTSHGAGSKFDTKKRQLGTVGLMLSYSTNNGVDDDRPRENDKTFDFFFFSFFFASPLFIHLLIHRIRTKNYAKFRRIIRGSHTIHDGCNWVIARLERF